MASINFHYPTISFAVPNPRKIASWLKVVIAKEKHALVELNFIFCSDEELYNINVEYLNHKTYTDIITFDNSDLPQTIEGDIYISIDRVKENSETYKKEFTDELRRVMVHGVLHLLGHGDKSEREQKKIRKKEDACLSLYS